MDMSSRFSTKPQGIHMFQFLRFLILNLRGDLLPKYVFGMNFISCLDSGAAGFGLPAFGSP